MMLNHMMATPTVNGVSREKGKRGRGGAADQYVAWLECRSSIPGLAWFWISVGGGAGRKNGGEKSQEEGRKMLRNLRSSIRTSTWSGVSKGREDGGEKCAVEINQGRITQNVTVSKPAAQEKLKRPEKDLTGKSGRVRARDSIIYLLFFLGGGREEWRG